jgi:hypothetical protein
MKKPAPAAKEAIMAESDRYKVVETSLVTDKSLEEIINEWVGKGWRFEDIRFAMREASKRPAMAFVLPGNLKGRYQCLPHGD